MFLFWLSRRRCSPTVWRWRWKSQRSWNRGWWTTGTSSPDKNRLSKTNLIAPPKKTPKTKQTNKPKPTKTTAELFPHPQWPVVVGRHWTCQLIKHSYASPLLSYFICLPRKTWRPSWRIMQTTRNQKETLTISKNKKLHLFQLKGEKSVIMCLPGYFPRQTVSIYFFSPHLCL